MEARATWYGGSGGAGRGFLENKHSTDVEYPFPPYTL